MNFHQAEYEANPDPVIIYTQVLFNGNFCIVESNTNIHKIISDKIRWNDDYVYAPGDSFNVSEHPFKLLDLVINDNNGNIYTFHKIKEYKQNIYTYIYLEVDSELPF